MNIYVKGTKKEAKEALLKNKSVMGVCHDLFNESIIDLSACPRGTVVKFWLKRDPWGTPIAKSYGCIAADKKTLKLKLV